MDRAGYVTFATQEQAEDYLISLPDEYNGKSSKTESGKWAVSFRKSSPPRAPRVIAVTYEIAMAAGRDAGNRSMTKADRTRWNEDDWNASVEVFNRMMGLDENGREDPAYPLPRTGA